MQIRGLAARVPTCLVAHDCGYPLSRYTCRATRVAADFLDFIAFCRCSTGVALHPLKILVSHLPPPCAGRCRTEVWVWKGVALPQLQLRVSRYTVQLSPHVRLLHGKMWALGSDLGLLEICRQQCWWEWSHRFFEKDDKGFHIRGIHDLGRLLASSLRNYCQKSSTHWEKWPIHGYPVCGCPFWSH